MPGLATRFTHDLAARSHALRSVNKYAEESSDAAYEHEWLNPLYELHTATKRRATAQETRGEDRLSRQLSRQVERALDTAKQLFVGLDVFADTGKQLSTDQLILIKEIFGSCLPALVGGPNIYKVVEDEIYLRYHIKWHSKVNAKTAGRRTGKSYSTALAMAIMAAVAPEFRGLFMNLFFTAGAENLNYMMNFISILEQDPKKRIRCSIIKKERIYYVLVKSHFQTLMEEENQIEGNDYNVVPPPNMLGSLPNMDANGGSVRGFPISEFVSAASNEEMHKITLFLNDDADPTGSLIDDYLRLLLLSCTLDYGPQSTPRIEGVTSPTDNNAIAWDKAYDCTNTLRFILHYPGSHLYGSLRSKESCLAGDFQLRSTWCGSYGKGGGFQNWRSVHPRWKIDSVCVLTPISALLVLQSDETALDTKDETLVTVLAEIQRTRNRFSLLFDNPETGEILGHIHARPIAFVLPYGPHYSAVISVDGVEWYHYDSLPSKSHHAAAERLVNFALPSLRGPTKIHNMSDYTSGMARRFQDSHASLVQHDGSSCLLYSMAAIDYFISTKFETWPVIEPARMTDEIVDNVIWQMRQSCIEWHDSIVQEGIYQAVM